MVLPSLMAGVSLETVSVATGSFLLGMLKTGFQDLMLESSILSYMFNNLKGEVAGDWVIP